HIDGPHKWVACSKMPMFYFPQPTGPTQGFLSCGNSERRFCAALATRWRKSGSTLVMKFKELAGEVGRKGSVLRCTPARTSARGCLAREGRTDPASCHRSSCHTPFDWVGSALRIILRPED